MDRLWSGPAGRFQLPSGLPTSYVTLTTTVNGCYVMPMSDEELLDVRFEMRASKSWIDLVEEWRSKQRPVPSRAEAIRRLVEKGLASE